MMFPFRQRVKRKLVQDVDMPFRIRDVTVKQVPERLNEKRCRLFFSEIESCMNVDRPSIVFDCSNVLQMDRSTVHLLLCCLEEAIKRNGDVRLAAIPSGPKTMLEFTGADRLFEIYETNADAINSFRQPQLFAVPRPGSALLSTEE